MGVVLTRILAAAAVALLALIWLEVNGADRLSYWWLTIKQTLDFSAQPEEPAPGRR